MNFKQLVGKDNLVRKGTGIPNVYRNVISVLLLFKQCMCGGRNGRGARGNGAQHCTNHL